MLHLVPPLALVGLAAWVDSHPGARPGPLAACACAFVLIQLVLGGMVGFGRKLMSVAVTAIFVFVEVLVCTGIAFALTR